MSEPRLCGGDLTRRRERPTLAREHAGDRIGSLVPRQGNQAAGDLVRLGEIEERRQQSPGCDDGRFGELWNAEQGDRGRRARVSTAATAQLVVPRSMPTRNTESEILSSHFSDIQFQLPPLVAIPLFAPELEGADFGDAAFEREPA